MEGDGLKKKKRPKQKRLKVGPQNLLRPKDVQSFPTVRPTWFIVKEGEYTLPELESGLIEFGVTKSQSKKLTKMAEEGKNTMEDIRAARKKGGITKQTEELLAKLAGRTPPSRSASPFDLSRDKLPTPKKPVKSDAEQVARRIEEAQRREAEEDARRSVEAEKARQKTTSAEEKAAKEEVEQAKSRKSNTTQHRRKLAGSEFQLKGIAEESPLPRRPKKAVVQPEQVAEALATPFAVAQAATYPAKKKKFDMKAAKELVKPPLPPRNRTVLNPETFDLPPAPKKRRGRPPKFKPDEEPLPPAPVLKRASSSNRSLPSPRGRPLPPLTKEDLEMFGNIPLGTKQRPSPKITMGGEKMVETPLAAPTPTAPVINVETLLAGAAALKPEKRRGRPKKTEPTVTPEKLQAQRGALNYVPPSEYRSPDLEPDTSMATQLRTQARKLKKTTPLQKLPPAPELPPAPVFGFVNPVELRSVAKVMSKKQQKKAQAEETERATKEELDAEQARLWFQEQSDRAQRDFDREQLVKKIASLEQKLETEPNIKKVKALEAELERKSNSLTTMLLEQQTQNERLLEQVSAQQLELRKTKTEKTESERELKKQVAASISLLQKEQAQIKELQAQNESLKQQLPPPEAPIEVLPEMMGVQEFGGSRLKARFLQSREPRPRPELLKRGVPKPSPDKKELDVPAPTPTAPVAPLARLKPPVEKPLEEMTMNELYMYGRDNKMKKLSAKTADGKAPRKEEVLRRIQNYGALTVKPVSTLATKAEQSKALTLPTERESRMSFDWAMQDRKGNLPRKSRLQKSEGSVPTAEQIELMYTSGLPDDEDQLKELIKQRTRNKDVEKVQGFVDDVLKRVRTDESGRVLGMSSIEFKKFEKESLSPKGSQKTSKIYFLPNGQVKVTRDIGYLTAGKYSIDDFLDTDKPYLLSLLQSREQEDEDDRFYIVMVDNAQLERFKEALTREEEDYFESYQERSLANELSNLERDRRLRQQIEERKSESDSVRQSRLSRLLTDGSELQSETNEEYHMKKLLQEYEDAIEIGNTTTQKRLRKQIAASSRDATPEVRRLAEEGLSRASTPASSALSTPAESREPTPRKLPPKKKRDESPAEVRPSVSLDDEELLEKLRNASPFRKAPTPRGARPPSALRDRTPLLSPIKEVRSLEAEPLRLADLDALELAAFKPTPTASKPPRPRLSRETVARMSKEDVSEESPQSPSTPKGKVSKQPQYTKAPNFQPQPKKKKEKKEVDVPLRGTFPLAEPAAPPVPVTDLESLESKPFVDAPKFKRAPQPKGKRDPSPRAAESPVGRRAAKASFPTTKLTADERAGFKATLLKNHDITDEFAERLTMIAEKAMKKPKGERDAYFTGVKGGTRTIGTKVTTDENQLKAIEETRFLVDSLAAIQSKPESSTALGLGEIHVDINSHNDDSESSSDEEMEGGACWKGYEMIGMKMKKGRKVPNCVPRKFGGDLMMQGEDDISENGYGTGSDDENEFVKTKSNSIRMLHPAMESPLHFRHPNAQANVHALQGGLLRDDLQKGYNKAVPKSLRPAVNELGMASAKYVGRQLKPKAEKVYNKVVPKSLRPAVGELAKDTGSFLKRKMGFGLGAGLGYGMEGMGVKKYAKEALKTYVPESMRKGVKDLAKEGAKKLYESSGAKAAMHEAKGHYGRAKKEYEEAVPKEIRQSLAELGKASYKEARKMSGMGSDPLHPTVIPHGTGMKMKKGSPEMKEHMAKLRAMKGKKMKGGMMDAEPPRSRSYTTNPELSGGELPPRSRMP